jgi:hypothetical protein
MSYLLSCFAHSQRLGILHCVECVLLKSVVVVPRRTRNRRETERIRKRDSFLVRHTSELIDKLVVTTSGCCPSIARDSEWVSVDLTYDVAGFSSSDLPGWSFLR